MTDLVVILGNLSQSLYPIQRLLTGGAYLLGIIFILIAIGKLKKIANTRGHSSSQEKMFAPVMYFIFGSALLYLPTAIQIMANTAFGVGNVLSYAKPNLYDVYSSMSLLIRTAGVLWFIRGCVLVAHASSPGSKLGPRGLAFLVAGVLAMNFENTMAMVNTIIVNLISWTMSVKVSQGY